MAGKWQDFWLTLLRRGQEALEGGPLTPEKAEAERNRLIAENPDWKEILDFAAAHPDQMEKVLRYARYIVRGHE